MFDLEKAIAFWRSGLEHRRALSTDDLDELEQHLRDHTAALVAAGRPARAAFSEALGAMGDYASAEAEYRKVRWGKLRRERQITDELAWRSAMLKNYLKVTLRNLWRHKSYTAINVLGLAVGLACCLLIGLYVYHEWSYDRFHENAERIYRLAQEQRTDATRKIALTSGSVGPELEREVPEVEETMRMAARTPAVHRSRETFFDQRMILADQSFFDVFSFSLLRGDAEAALAAPFSLVLTKAAAERYFGGEDPVGKTLALSGDDSSSVYTVTGIMADVPANSHLQFEGVISFATIEATNPESLESGARYWTYVLLEEGVDPAVMEAKLDAFLERRYGAEALEQLTYFLQPLTDIHLRSDVSFDVHQGGSASVVYVLAVIALFVLLIACINFMNLSTARSGKRAKEVGLRKVLGAYRRGLVGQFLSESVVLALLSMLGALLLAGLAFPAFSALADTAFRVGMLFRVPVLLALLGVALMVGVLAGSYPAFVLSAFQPVRALKGEKAQTGGGARFRQGLVVFQFTLTIALLAATIITFQQLDYVRAKDLGFNEAHLISVPIYGGAQQAERLRNAWSGLPGVAEVTTDSRSSVSGLPKRYVGREGTDSSFVMVNFFNVAANYADAMDIDLVAGRTFSPEIASDSAEAVLVNEAAVRTLGWASPEEAVGERLRFVKNEWRIIGVTRDFHHGSLHEEVEPVLIQWRSQSARRLLVRMRPERVQETLAAMNTSWQSFEPKRPFIYDFLGDMLAQLYEDDRKQGRLFGFFSGLAIFIACLGLFGLTSFATEQRTKEIGVRKVLGASITSVVVLFSKEFLKLIGIAFVIAAPVAYVAMDWWLGRFAYRTSIGVAVFLSAGAAALGVALLTVGYQSIKAATANPVDALRYE